MDTQLRKAISMVFVALIVMGGLAVFIPGAYAGTLGQEIMASHGVIRINSDAEFASMAASEGWAGDGTLGNPYIIENYEINGNGYGYGMYVGNVTKHFIIQNCDVRNASGGTSSPWYSNAGLILYNVNNATIFNNTMAENDGNGIDMILSSDNTIKKNNATTNRFGIYLESGAVNNTIDGNNASSNSNAGIFASRADRGIIANNTISFNGQSGISAGSSPGLVISNNTISSNGNSGGIYMERNTMATITGNTLVKNSIFMWGDQLSGWNTHTIDTTNTVNGKPVYYYKNQSNIAVPSDAGEVILANCTNMTVSGMDSGDSTVAVQVGFSSNTSIDNSNINQSHYAMMLCHSDHTFVNGSSMDSNYYGVYIFYSNFILVNNSRINNSSYGIWINHSSYVGVDGNGMNDNYNAVYMTYSNDIEVNNSILSGNAGDALYSIHSVSYVNITNCSISHTSGSGMYLMDLTNGIIAYNNISNNQNGIYLRSSSDNSIHGNTIDGNNNFGILLRTASNTNVWDNNISNNNNYGLYSDSNGVGNSIYHNNFMGNTHQAYDEQNNVWNTSYPEGGNYWSDYAGYAGNDIYKGVNQDQIGQDGIGDTPQDIDGSSSQDAYPLMKPWNGTIPSDTEAPSITGTNPANNSVNVNISQQIIISFSEFMNQSTVTYTCEPDPGGWTASWSASTPTLTLYHAHFDYNQAYRFTITGGKDLSGKDLTNVPYIINFTSEADTIPPVVHITSPTEGEFLNSTVVTTQWVGWDNETGINHYDFSTDGHSWIDNGLSTSITGSLPEGNNTIYVRAVDNSSNFAIAMVNITIDTVDPGLTISSPSDGDYLTTGTSVTVWWNGSDVNPLSYEVRIDGGSWISVGSTNHYDFNSLAQGNHTVDVRATDPAGNNNTDSVSFAVDTIRPAVSITSPEPNHLFNTSSVTFTWNGWDNETGLDHYNVSTDGGVAWSSVGLDTNYTAENLSDGFCNFAVMVFDMAGNSNRSDITVRIDTTAPILWIQAPSNGRAMNYTHISVTWGVLDSSYSEVSMDGAPWIYAGQNTSMDFFNLSEGVHNVRVRAFDEAGNSNISTSSFRIDLTAPYLRITHPEMNVYLNGNYVNFTWDGGDNQSGIDHYFFRIPGVSDWVIAGNGSYYNYPGAFSNGWNTVEIQARDMAGNTVTRNVTFLVDTLAPQITVNNPTDNGFTNRTEITVNWTADDSSDYFVTSGISHFEVSVNGGTPVNVGNVTEYTITGLTEGYYEVTVTAFDNAGNNASPASSYTEFSVDLSPPVVEISSVSVLWEEYRATIRVDWELNDTDGTAPVDGYEVRMDDGDWISVSRQEHSFYTNVSGNHTVYVRAHDSAGNLGPTVSEAAYVDLNAPEAIQYSPQGENVPSDSPVSITFSEEIWKDTFSMNVHGGYGIYYGNISWNGNTATFVSDEPFRPGETVTVTVLADDLAGNRLEFTWSFNVTGNAGEGSGTVTGSVVDENGDPVPGAEIIHDGFVIAHTDGDGHYSVVIPSGEQTLTISMNGTTEEVHVTVPDGGSVDAGETSLSSGDSGSSMSLYAIIGIILLIVLIAAVFMMKGKKSAPPEDVPEQSDEEDIGETEEQEPETESEISEEQEEIGEGL